MRPSLRLFIGEDELSETGFGQPEVSMELQELTEILSHAIVRDRTWLADFGNERIRVSADLYEVLMSYTQLRPSA